MHMPGSGPHHPPLESRRQGSLDALFWSRQTQCLVTKHGRPSSLDAIFCKLQTMRFAINQDGRQSAWIPNMEG